MKAGQRGSGTAEPAPSSARGQELHGRRTTWLPSELPRRPAALLYNKAYSQLSFPT